MAKRKLNIPISRLPMKRSRQRDQILQSLCETKRHPTAQELFAMVRRRMPRISLATVYRNLEQLADAGLVLRLDGGPSRRYDGDLSSHAHVRCEICGATADLDGVKPESLVTLPTLGIDSGYRISGYSVEFTGHCPQCQKRA